MKILDSVQRLVYEGSRAQHKGGAFHERMAPGTSAWQVCLVWNQCRTRLQEWVLVFAAYLPR